jgi:hypothetical protein
VRAKQSGFSGKAPLGALLFAVLVQFPWSQAAAGPKVVDTGDLSLELGLRLQPRMELERAGLNDWTRDFLIRRTRLKALGTMRKVAFNFEWKIDRTDQIGQSASASVENAWLQYPLGGGASLKAGLYDQPFSRDRLTSDSRQLAVDRGVVSNVPDAVGLADNAVGLHVLGKFDGGLCEYAVGLFDNRTINGPFQDLPMVVARLDFNFGEKKDVLRDAHFGDGSWYSLGVNGSWQGEIENAAGLDEGERAAVGADGMIDVPLEDVRVLVRSEFNCLELRDPAGGNTLDTRVWMLGGGVLLAERFQPFARFDQVLLDDAVGGGSRNITYVGANWYRNGHSSKLQGDLRFEAGTGHPVDGVRLQAQLDF